MAKAKDPSDTLLIGVAEKRAKPEQDISSDLVNYPSDPKEVLLDRLTTLRLVELQQIEYLPTLFTRGVRVLRVTWD